MPIPAASITVAQVLIKGEMLSTGGGSKNIYAIFNYRRTAVAIAPNKTNLVTAFTAGPYAAILAAANQDWANFSAYTRWLNDAEDAAQLNVLAGVGAIATDRAPNFAAVYFLFKTALRGRRFAGSKHLAGVNEVDTTGDILVGAGLTRWQAVQTALATPLVSAEGNTWNPAVVSYSRSQLKTNPTTVVVNDVTQVVLDRSIGTMKRRKVKTLV